MQARIGALAGSAINRRAVYADLARRADGALGACGCASIDEADVYRAVCPGARPRHEDKPPSGYRARRRTAWRRAGRRGPLHRTIQPIFFGALALLGAAASGALSNFVVKLRYKDKGVPASTTSFFALSVASLLTLPVAIATAPRELPGVRAVLAVIVLGLGCTALAYMLYYRLIGHVGEERAALANYLIPVFALFYGVLLLGESLTVAAIIGLVLIIVGAEITLRGAGNRHAGGDLRTQHRVHPPFH